MTSIRSMSCAVAAVAVLGFPVQDITARLGDMVVQSRVAGLLDTLPDVTSGLVTVRRGRLSLHRILATGHGWSATIGTLSLPCRSAWNGFASSALADDGNVTADDLTLAVGDRTILVPHLELRGTSLTLADIKALADPSSPVPLRDRLAKLTAAVVIAGDVTVAPASTGAGPTIVIRDVMLTDVDAGRIGAVTAQHVDVMTAEVGAQAIPAFEAEKIEIEGVDLPLALDIATAARNDAAAPLTPLYRSLSVRDIHFRPEADTKVDVGEVRAGALRFRSLLVSFSDLFALLDKPLSQRTTVDRKVLGDVAVDAMQSASLDHLEVADVALRQDAVHPVSLTVAHAVLDGLDAANLGSFSMQGFGFSGNGVGISLAHLVVGGYDETGLYDLTRHQIAMEPNAPGDVDLRAVIPKRASLALSDLHVDGPATSAQSANTANGTRTIVDFPVLSFMGAVDPQTGTITSAARAAALYDMPTAAPVNEMVAKMELKRLALEAGYAMTLDPAAQQLSIDKMSVSVADLGGVSLQARFANVGPGVLQAASNTAQTEKAIQNVALQSVTVDVANGGLFEKMLPPLAAAAKASVPLLRAEMKAQAEVSIGQTLGPTPSARRLIAAVRAFVDNPKTLHVAVLAPPGLTLGHASSAADAKALLDGLDIQAAADQ